MVSPTGSGRARDRAHVGGDAGEPRASSSVRRSSRDALSPSSAPGLHVARVGLQDLRRALLERVGHGCSAAFLVAVLELASAREAARASAQISATERVVVAIGQGYPRELVQHEVVAVHSLLGGARHELAHRVGLHAPDAPQLAAE